MQRLKNVLVLFLACLVLPTATEARGRVDEAWVGTSFSQDLPWDFALEFTQEMRFEDAARSFEQILAEIALEHRYNRMFSSTVEYRTFVEYKKRGERIGFSTSAQLDTGPVRHELRLKYQNEWRTNRGRTEELRTRYEMTYRDLDRFSPYASIEGYSAAALTARTFAKTRLTLGLKVKLTRANDLDLFYRTRQIRGESDFTEILGLQLEMEIKSVKLKSAKDD